MSELQVQSVEVQSLKTRLKELETALTQAEEQVRSEPEQHPSSRRIRVQSHPDGLLQAARADEVLTLVQVQQRRGEEGGKVEELQTQLMEEQRRSQQLEEALRLQVQQSSRKQASFFLLGLWFLGFRTTQNFVRTSERVFRTSTRRRCRA